MSFSKSSLLFDCNILFKSDVITPKVSTVANSNGAKRFTKQTC